MRYLATILCSIGWFFSSATAQAAIAVGAPAPEFSATTTQGTTLSLSALKGKTVVLEWTNHQCPFVRKYYDKGHMQQLQKDATAAGIVWISINSSAAGKEGHVDAARANELTTERGASPAHVILDEKGEIGRRYGAKTTPHMFVIDPSGTLVYMGAIDSKPSPNTDDIAGATNYVTAALAALKAGTPVEPASTQPYGCSVKY